jgi:hypothetical protein
MRRWLVKVKLDPALAGGALDFLGSRQKAFALQFLAGELAGTADCLGLLARLALRGLFIMATKLHFPENALALHLLLEGLERLIDVIVANNYLHEQTFICATKGQSPFKMAGGISEVPRDVEGVEIDRTFPGSTPAQRF